MRTYAQPHLAPLLALAACLSITVISAPARANLIINGDFAQEVPRNATGGGWISRSIDGIGGWQAFVGTPEPSFRLNTGAGLAASIEQRVSGLTIGALYTISGDYALGFGGGTPDDTFQVELDMATILSLGPDPLHDPDPQTFPFAPFGTSFIATETSHIIRFIGQATGADHDYFIDNIQMTPEPGTATLMGLGATVGLLFRRRRRQVHARG